MKKLFDIIVDAAIIGGMVGAMFGVSKKSLEHKLIKIEYNPMNNKTKMVILTNNALKKD